MLKTQRVFEFVYQTNLLHAFTQKLRFHPKLRIQLMGKIGISHKTFAYKAPFPFIELKRTKS